MRPSSTRLTYWSDNPDGRLKPGMVGVARVYGRRRSLAGWSTGKSLISGAEGLVTKLKGCGKPQPFQETNGSIRYAVTASPR